MAPSHVFSVALRDELLLLLSPLTAAAQSPGGVRMLMQSVGRSSALGERDDLRAEIERLAGLAQAIARLDADALGSWTGLAEVLRLSHDALTAIRGLERSVSDPALADQLGDLGVDLVEHLLAVYLRTRHPTIFRAAGLLTLITPAELAPPLPQVVSGSAIVKAARYADAFHPERFEQLLKRPLPTLAAHYFPNQLIAAQDAHEAARRLFPVLTLLAQALDLPTFTDDLRAIPPAAPTTAVGDSDADHFSGAETGDQEAAEIPAPAPADLTSFFESVLPRWVMVLAGQAADGAVSPARFALAALVSSGSHPGGARGLVISPLGQLGWSETRGDWRISLESSGQVPAFVIGPDGVSGAAADPALSAATARLLIERVAAADVPAFVVGAADGTRLELGALRMSADVSITPAESSVALSADARSGMFVLAPGDGDGFVSAVLPSDGLRIAFDLGIELSSAHGLRLRGGAGLDASVPVGLSIGPVSVPELHLQLGAGEAGLSAEVSASVRVTIGPVEALIDRVGITATATFTDDGGNLGIGDLTLDFKPPKGVGLAIESAMVSGGGALLFDPARGQYAGMVRLNLEGGIALTGVGLIATQLPDGSRGFSLLVIITAEDFAPVPLGLGFRLTGIGGLLALNRTFSEEALRAGLKTHALDSVLFPRDPIRNASQILSALSGVFPPARGHHLFGPMVRIEWGTPALLTADLAVVLEFGARLRLLIMGRLAAILPRPDHDLLRIQMDALGVLDFDQGTAALDATLHDSRLLNRFALTGEMAMRLKWQGAPAFALAVGGLHPAFNPPPGFPKLARVAINLTTGNNPRLRCEAYFALTANTVQFGARAELYAAASGFSVQGEVGFDVLIQLDPFQFLAEFHAQMQLKRGSTNLFKVKLQGALAGPRPLHIKGKASFEILWMDVSIRFDRTLVAGERPPAPAPVDVLALLRGALAAPASWTSRLPDRQRAPVTLRDRPDTGDELLLHPLGTLQVRQGVVPLNIDIDRFGPAVPAGARRFSIDRVSIGDQAQSIRPVSDFFAPAQFLELSDDQKLSRPSFESLAAGVTIGSDDFDFGVDDLLDVEAISYETIILDTRSGATRPDGQDAPYRLSALELARQARFGAAGASDLRRSGRERYLTDRVAYSIAKEGWSIVAVDDLAAQALPGVEDGRPASYSEAVQALHTLDEQQPARAGRLAIVRLSELR